jgi:hypothetical protein
MGFFGIGTGKGKDTTPKTVQRSMDSVAVAKKRMSKTKSQRDADDAQEAAEDAELAQMDETPAKNLEHDGPPVSTYNPSASPAKPAVKSAMKKASKFNGDGK